jgi:uncharacterized protein YndB with AHSA1/START domain
VKKISAVMGGMFVLIFLSTFIGGDMTELKHEITIDSSPEKVFSVLENLEAVQHYNPTVTFAKYISDHKSGAGAARECELGDAGKVRERVTAVDPGKSITMELYEHNWPIKSMQWTTNVLPDGSGTKVTQRLTYEMKFGLLGRLLNKLVMRNKLDNTLNEVFVSMKGYIEKN